MTFRHEDEIEIAPEPSKYDISAADAASLAPGRRSYEAEEFPVIDLQQLKLLQSRMDKIERKLNRLISLFTDVKEEITSLTCPNSMKGARRVINFDG